MHPSGVLCIRLVPAAAADINTPQGCTGDLAFWGRPKWDDRFDYLFSQGRGACQYAYGEGTKSEPAEHCRVRSMILDETASFQENEGTSKPRSMNAPSRFYDRIIPRKLAGLALNPGKIELASPAPR
jgi:hypothetical protein